MYQIWTAHGSNKWTAHPITPKRNIFNLAKTSLNYRTIAADIGLEIWRGEIGTDISISISIRHENNQWNLSSSYTYNAANKWKLICNQSQPLLNDHNWVPIFKTVSSIINTQGWLWNSEIWNLMLQVIVTLHQSVLPSPNKLAVWHISYNL